MTVLCTGASISSTRRCATHKGPSFPRLFVVPEKAGTHRRETDWTPACTESTPSVRPSHGKKVLGAIEKKCSGGSDGVVACAGKMNQEPFLPTWKCKRPPVARGPSCSYASTVCVVARLCSWEHNWEHVGDGDDVVDRIPSHVAAE